MLTVRWVAYAVCMPNLKSCEPFRKSLALCETDASMVVRLWNCLLPVRPLTLEKPVA